MREISVCTCTASFECVIFCGQLTTFFYYFSYISTHPPTSFFPPWVLAHYSNRFSVLAPSTTYLPFSNISPLYRAWRSVFIGSMLFLSPVNSITAPKAIITSSIDNTKFYNRSVVYATCTLSVIGVGVTLAVCLKGQKLKNRFFGGLRNQYAPKT